MRLDIAAKSRLTLFRTLIQNYISVISEAFYVQDDNVAWWVDSGATSHVCKDLYWFKDFQPIEDGYVVKMGNVATEPIKGI